MKLIAETAWHHQGDYGFMQELFLSINRRTEADIVKFHLTLDLDEYMSGDHPLYQTLKSWMLGEEQWKEIIKMVVSSNKELMLLFNDRKAVEFGMCYNPSNVEIHSVSLNDIHLLRALKQHLGRKTMVFLGVGGSTLYEIEHAINILQTPNIVLMFGFQNYPTNYKNINFTKMRRIMRLFPDYKFGYADHTAWDEPNNILITLLGAALGMDYVEKHVTIALGEERADWSACVSIEMLNQINEGIAILEKCNGDSYLALNPAEEEYRRFGPMKKAGILCKDVQSGDLLTEDIICFKRSSQVTDFSQIEVLNSISNKFRKNFKCDHVLMFKDLERK